MMFIELDGQGPHYAQLVRALKASILDGRLTAGSQLPPTRELACDLELSRTTVLAAYEQLRAEGYIQGRIGSGSYVANVQTHRPPRANSDTVAAPSRYARRARQLHDPRPAQQHYDMRYNLQYCNPLVNPALFGIWGRELAYAATRVSLDKAEPQGLLALREQICDYLGRRRGISASPKDVLITSGTQQAFSLTARVLLDEGDTVALEEPHYFGAYQAWTAHGARICSVRTDDYGLVCDDLPVTAPRLICVTPSHQFPSGAAMSLPRRLELLRYAETHPCWIFEDDFDGEFRYDAHPLAALRSLDQHDCVIYAGTFSKTMFGALRLGYMVLPASLRQDFTTAKYLDDLSCPEIEQAALAHFMASGGFERHLRRARKELKARHHAVIQGLLEHAGDRVEIVDAPAGMYVLAWLRDYDTLRADALIALARQRGLGLHSMAMHYLKPAACPGLMFGYSRLSVPALREAMRVFGTCLNDMESPEAPSWCTAARFAVS
jgi:GntR family transcriptional regulator / MocR family aminotransferase